MTGPSVRSAGPSLPPGVAPRADSRADGPITRYPPTGSVTSSEGMGSARGMRFLAVEDSASARKVIQGVLVGLGVGTEDLRLASDAEAGLAIASDWQPDVVFLDMELWGPEPPGDGTTVPAASGDALGRTLLKNRRPPKVVVMTALDRDNPRVQSLLGEGAVDVILKPVRAARVHEVLARLGFNSPADPPARSH
jgi:CheY-like chemotaxis protein